MMLLLLLGAIAVAVVFFLLHARFTYANLPAMVLPFVVVFFLSRFDVMFRWSLDGRHVLGIHSLLAVAAVIAVLLVGLGRSVPLPGRREVAVGGGLFALISIASGAYNGGTDGTFAALHVLMIAGPPLAAAFAYVALWPRRHGGLATLTDVYLLFIGVLTPLILITTALWPDVLGAKLGWKPAVDDLHVGFYRGWSPLGSAIGTGCLVMMAYALALHEAMTTGRPIYRAVALLAGVSLAFTLARSVMLLFVVFHGLYWWWYARPRRRHGVILGPVAIGLLFLFVTSIAGGFSFQRFIETEDFSTNIRESSARVAFRVSGEKPLLGHGPGQLYEEIRTTWLFDPTGGDKRKVVMIDGTMTAQEPHNLYLWIAVEHGYLALAAFLLILWVPWRASHIERGAPDRDVSFQAMSRALLIGIALFFLTNSGPLADPQFAFFLWLWLFLPLYHAAGRKAEPAV